MQFDFRDLFTDAGTARIRNQIQPGPGWGVGSTGSFPGLSPPAPEPAGQLRQTANATELQFHADGLRADVTYEQCANGNIVRWSGRILNDGSEPHRCHRPRSLATMLELEDDARVSAFSLNGGVGTGCFPPDSFSFRRRELFPGLLDRLDSGRGGYSSNNNIPMAVIRLGDTGGLFWALEWPGMWWACTNRLLDEPGKIWLEAGPVARLLEYEQVEQIDILLEPGEAIPLPPVVVGLFAGDELDGCNALRSYIASNTPRLTGNPPLPPVSFDSWFGAGGLGLQTSEDGLKPHIDAAARTGAEYFVHDAGWYAGSNRSGHDFMTGTGNWRCENREKFPSGLEAVAKLVEEKGMKFGIWWAPENCDGASELATTFPDGVLPLQEGDPTMVGNWNLVDFGNPAVIEWLKETLDLIVPRFHVQWLRWDLNIYPEPAWDRADPAGRRGITQIRHVEGLLELWDHLLANHPGICIEACCGGGRRMDLACLRRSHTYWCNDMSREPDLQRYENTGANHFLPATYLNRNILYGSGDGYPAAYYHGLMAGAFGFGDPLGDWTEDALAEAGEHVSVFKRIRHLLGGRYRPLFGQSTSLDEWDGWQFHDEQDDRGFITVFRCRSKESWRVITLQWLSPDKPYTFVDPYTDEQRTEAGGKVEINLATEGDSVLLTYALNDEST